MTEKDIAAIIGKDRVIARHLIVCPNVNHLLPGQQDMISVTRAGLLIEYEIKISRGDFKKDVKKGKEDSFKAIYRRDHTPNQFYYVVPANMIQVEELPWYAGLFFIQDGKLMLMKKAPMIHEKKHDLLKIYSKITTLYQERFFLGGCLMTYKNRTARERFANRKSDV